MENRDFQCSNCQVIVPVKKCKDEKSHFLVSPLARQLKDMLESTDLWNLIEKGKFSRRSTGRKGDITTGDSYQSYSGFLAESRYNFTMSFFADSFTTSRSSKSSLFTIMCSFNEIPFYFKSMHLILHTLWPSPKPRRSDTLLRCFVEETIRLEDVGVIWKDSNGLERVSKVRFTTLVADGTARPFLTRSMQFNGKCGCGHCEHEGIEVKKGRGRVRVYPIRIPLPPDRTHSQNLEYADAATNNNPAGAPVRGVKGPTWLYLVPSFDVVDGLIPDSMHAVFIGIVGQFLKLWLKSTRNAPYHVRVERFDQIIASTKVPAEVEKLPRMSDNKWKAQEKRNFLFFYSVPALRLLLEQKYYQHWMLLVNAIRLVSKKEFLDDAIDIAIILANEFVLRTERLYGIHEVSYNVHLLIHVVEYARKWGGLWGTSAFMFEAEIAKLKRYYHGSKAPEKQIFGFSSMRSRLRGFSSRYIPFARDDIQEFYKKLDGSIYARPDLPNSSEALGAGIPTLLNPAHVLSIENVSHCVLTCHYSYSYQRTFYNGKLFSTSQYAVDQRRDNSLVVLRDKRTVRITKIFELLSDCHCAESGRRCSIVAGYKFGRKRLVFFGEILDFNPLPPMPHALTNNFDLLSIISAMPSNPRTPLEYICFLPSDIDVKCICMTIGEFTYRILVDVRMELD